MDALAVQLASDKSMPLISNEILHLPVLYIVKLLSARVGFIADDIVDFFVDFQQNVLRNSTGWLFQLHTQLVPICLYILRDLASLWIRAKLA